MYANQTDLDPLEKICHRICLNIPDSYQWNWDEDRDMAYVALKRDDAEIVFYPLFKEFKYQWDFSSDDDSEETVIPQINSKFGLLPGQAFFSSRPVCDLILLVAWWPWGKDEKISMRVGLIPATEKSVPKGLSYKLLSRWLNLGQ